MMMRTETEHKAQTTGFLVTFTKEPLVEAAGYFLEQSFRIDEFIPVFFHSVSRNILRKRCHTFPSERREDVRGNGPLNTSQIKQPSRQTSPALRYTGRVQCMKKGYRPFEVMFFNPSVKLLRSHSVSFLI